MNAVQRPKSSAYSLGALDEAGLAEDPHPDPRARPDDRREDRLPLHVPPERGLDLLRKRWPTVRREARVDRALQPRHVQEHVDRDDDDQDRREEQQHDRDRRALGELDPFLHVAGDVPGAERVDPLVHLLAHLNALEPVVVEPCLQPVDVPLRLGLAGRRVLVRDVLVDPLRRVSRLVECDGADGDQQRGDRGGEDRVDDRHRERARDLEPRQVPHERVQHERDDRSGQEEEEHMPERAREQERDDEEHGQADELDPSRNLDRRAGAAHVARSYRAPRVRRECGVWLEARPRLRVSPCYGPGNDDSALTACGAATCQPATGPGPGAAVRARHGDRRRRRRDLRLTAFDDNAVPSSSGAPVPAPLPVTSAPPEAQVLATVGNLRVQSPVARGGVTAVGFHGSTEGALVLQPVGPQANEGLLARLWRKITGSSRTGLAWYQLESGAAANARRRRSRRDGRLLAGRRHRRRDPRPARLGPQDRRRDRAPADVCTVTRRHDPERAARHGAGRRRERGRRELEAGTRRGHQQVRAPVPRALRRRRREQRRDPGVPLGNARRSLGFRL